MWNRLINKRLLDLWRQFPAVLILGARQVGKTTLARSCFPSLPYRDLEEPATRQLFTDDPTCSDRGHERLAIEIKAGRGDKLDALRILERAATDIEASRAWIIDQVAGQIPVRPNIERRGFMDSVHWLP